MLAKMEALFIEREVVPCMMYDVSAVPEPKLVGVIKRIKDAAHVLLDNVVINGTQIGRCLAIYEPIKFGELSYLYTANFPSLKAENPEFDDIFVRFGLKKRLRICLNRNPHGMSLSELQRLFNRKYSFSSIIVIDFELYEGSGAGVKVSEIGACKVQDGEISSYHAFLAPDTALNSSAARYTSNVITGIPLKPDSRIQYVEYNTAVIQFRNFIGNEQVVFAKGKRTEEDVLRKMKINVQVEEVYPVLCEQKGVQLFNNMEGNRCYFHAATKPKFHCALEDASEWGNEFVK